jgi:hypothetical protein
MGAYKNVMEILVEQEVMRQLKALPPRMGSYINQVELVAYALNQLPALYATSEKGLEYQLERGKSKFSNQIYQAVQRALAAIRRDPLRTYAPLQIQQSPQMRDVLHQLRLLLRNDKLDWEHLPVAVKEAIGKSSHGTAATYAPYQERPHRRPGIYTRQPAPKPAARLPKTSFGSEPKTVFGTTPKTRFGEDLETSYQAHPKTRFGEDLDDQFQIPKTSFGDDGAAPPPPTTPPWQKQDLRRSTGTPPAHTPPYPQQRPVDKKKQTVSTRYQHTSVDNNASDVYGWDDPLYRD